MMNPYDPDTDTTIVAVMSFSSPFLIVTSDVTSLSSDCLTVMLDSILLAWMTSI